MAGTLYLVGTPIGNLEDISMRAVRVLKEADLIAAEDTRTSRRLLDAYEITRRSQATINSTRKRREMHLSAVSCQGSRSR